MQYITLVILIILSLVYQKSKRIAVANTIFMWIIVTFCYNNADYANYLKIYENTDIISDQGFAIMCKIFNGLGFSYNVMLGVISAICLYLLYSAFGRMSDKIALVTMLYLLFPFPADAIQIRNFIAMSIVIYALKFLEEGHTKKDTAFYLICVLIAMSFHVLAIVYIILPIVNKLSVKLNLLVGFLGSFVIVGAFRILGQYFQRIGEYNSKVSLIAVILYMLPFLFLYIAGIYLCNIKANKNITDSTNKLIMKSCIYLSMYNMLLFANLNYHRIVRNFIPVLNIQYAEVFKLKLTTKKLIVLGMILSAVIVKMIIGMKDRIILLENNYFFDLFVIGEK